MNRRLCVEIRMTPIENLVRLLSRKGYSADTIAMCVELSELLIADAKAADATGRIPMVAVIRQLFEKAASPAELISAIEAAELANARRLS